MRLPFTVEQFFQVFGEYNTSLGLAYPVLLVAAATASVLALRGTLLPSRVVSAVLAAFWIWMGTVYHWIFFSRINHPAWLFGALFIVEGVALLWLGVVKQRLLFRLSWSLNGALGTLLVLYSLLGYPALGYVFGHRYPATPTFGLPCPTVIFTLGLMLWLVQPFPRAILVIPVVWAVIGTFAAFQLAVPQDFGLLVAALFTVRVASKPVPPLRRWIGRQSANAQARSI